jgi:nucleotide-binding universal stress UspA family protein
MIQGALFRGNKIRQRPKEILWSVDLIYMGAHAHRGLKQIKNYTIGVAGSHWK